MRVVAEKAEDIKDDPKPMARATWKRIECCVEHEAIHRDWGCALYRLHRTGRINNDQREAGDRYGSLIRDFRKLWHDPMGDIEVYRTPGYDSLDRRSKATADVEHLLGMAAADSLRAESEFEIKRAKRIGKRYKEARDIVGPINSKLEELLINDVWPVGEKGHVEISHALTRLSHFFNTGTKRKR